MRKLGYLRFCAETLVHATAGRGVTLCGKRIPPMSNPEKNPGAALCAECQADPYGMAEEPKDEMVFVPPKPTGQPEPDRRSAIVCHVAGSCLGAHEILRQWLEDGAHLGVGVQVPLRVAQQLERAARLLQSLARPEDPEGLSRG